MIFKKKTRKKMCQKPGKVCSRNVHKGYSKILSNKSKALTICCAIPRHAADNAWTTGADASGMPPEALSLQEREKEREKLGKTERKQMDTIVSVFS